MFDSIGLDHYRDARHRSRYTSMLAEYRRFRKPIIIAETGVCTYRGAADLGAEAAFAILDGQELRRPVREENLP